MGRALTKDQLLMWKDRIVRQRNSGLGVAEFCRQESVSVANFYRWKGQLKGAAKSATRNVKTKSSDRDDSVEPPATFVQVPLPEPQGAAWIEIVAADGTQIRLPHQNLDALELTLATISSRRSRQQ